MRWEKKSKDNLPLTCSLINYFFSFNIYFFFDALIHFKEKNF